MGINWLALGKPPTQELPEMTKCEGLDFLFTLATQILWGYDSEIINASGE